jgi:hypothetical protein
MFQRKMIDPVDEYVDTYIGDQIVSREDLQAAHDAKAAELRRLQLEEVKKGKAAQGDKVTRKGYDPVNPPHYARGPMIHIDIGEKITKGIKQIAHPLHCIDVMRHIKDPRLATAFKYLWRVAFGGKREPGDTRDQRAIDIRDLESAIWYLQDYIDNPTQP